jgi:hypothetical protein
MFLAWEKREIVGNHELKSHLEDIGVNEKLILHGS